jgi:leucyl-tRNA synthetase
MENKKIKNNLIYDHSKIEKRWQKFWDENKVYKTLDAKSAISKKLKPHYVLDMFPYPSGAGLHVGHPRGYIGSDVYARMKRMQGFNVLHPMGFDSFGLPAEQYAIKTGKHPGPFTDKLVEQYKKQLSIIGFSYDWDRMVTTHNSEYYKFTQEIFLKIYNSYFDTKKQKAFSIDNLIKIFEKSGNKIVNENTAHGDVTSFNAKEWKAFSKLQKQDILMKYRLAYEGYAEVNWCEELGTVLANDEIVDTPNGPVSERGEYPVIKKSMRQWFMRISAYGDRLLDGLNHVDFLDSTKETQRNWIGKSIGSEIEFKLDGLNEKVKIFTTRPDTIFGVTYIVLSPENSLVQDFILSFDSGVTNKSEIEKYIDSIKNKTNEERQNNKTKTGVEVKGLYAINPANNEKIPVWIADYVLASYGTGAVMAVPAHDDRDFEFANKYQLPIKRVIEPQFFSIDSPIKKDLPIIKRNAICAIIRNPKNGKYLCSVWKNIHMHGLITGGIEEGEDMVAGAIREIYEETGYKNIKLVNNPDIAIHSSFFHRKKEENRWARFQYLFFELINEEQDQIDEKEASVHDIVWKSREELNNFFSVIEGEFSLRLIDNPKHIHTGSGLLVNSGEYSGMNSIDAQVKIIKAVDGKIVTKYKMRDAIFARQRYWGEPIPLYRDKDGIIHEVKKLPLTLPNLKSFAPSGNGQSPLVNSKEWVKSGYETNTMPGWAGSSWYFLRYTDPNNKKQIASKENLDFFFGKNGGVDMYVGGTEHNTGHLLYARFWHKVLHDLGVVKSDEPFRSLRHQGMIGGADGRKMSKRWGNVINPDDIVKTYGADTLRVYEMFLGPFDSHLPWNTESIMGSRRFIERVWRASLKVLESKSKTNIDVSYALQDLILKVSNDIAEFKFNTAISAMMIFLGLIEDKNCEISNDDFVLFIKLLAPFAPYVADEIYSNFGFKSSIHKNDWPKSKKLKERILMQKIIVQFNGKLRGEISVMPDTKQEEIVGIINMDDKYRKYFENGELIRTIFIPNKIINFVIKIND